ncbi:hypothetical protein GTO91_07580 [Heliobacterium undosum]|uniref:Uncharacterized protein n=1 Tax=Heliomicrobium undosum TaxID=121734 RepID=A0A845L3G5_9FIRM|nr:DUF6544 family protein [Heliomicrobium undosum]MZP29565.1 hypothetical protein [Heliomicrobium undosum]
MMAVLRGLVGLLAIALVLVFAVAFVSKIQFNQMVKSEVTELLQSSVASRGGVVQKADLERLPGPVQKWLEKAQVVGKERIQTVRLKQRGAMRTSPEGAWMPVEAEQYVTTAQPRFIWKANVQAAPFISLLGRDKYIDGSGEMVIKLLGLVPVANARGEEMNQGSMVRFLAEMVWYPSAALNDYIQWEAVDDHTAKATMRYGGTTETGLFGFNDNGDVVSFLADRYMEKDGTYSLEKWSINSTEHEEKNGIRIPNKSSVTWRLSAGDFEWFRLEVIAVEYNAVDGSMQ